MALADKPEVPQTRRPTRRLSLVAIGSTEPGAEHPQNGVDSRPSRKSLGTQRISAMLRHASAHWRQARAHAWQCSWSCLAHSAPHASHTPAHARQNSRAKSLPRAIKPATRRHVAEQTMSSRTHSAIICTSSSFKHAVAQPSQASAHEFKALTIASDCWCTLFLRGSRKG